MDDISQFLQESRDRRNKQSRQVPQNPLFRSEYNRIIMLCYQYSQAFIEAGSSRLNPMANLEVESRRNRIFQTIAMVAKHRKELKTVEEYFGDREYGVFNGTIAEFEALEYVSYVQDRVTELNDWKVEIGEVDEESYENENMKELIE